MKKVCVLGSGAFGTAMACLLADNGCEVNIWCCEPDVVESINLENINNLYLPEIKLSENILAFTDLGPAIADCEIIFEAVPVKFLRSVLIKAKPYFCKEQIWVCCSKGIENETLLFSSQILDSVFENKVKTVVVSGPSFAKELANKQLTAVDIASQDQDLLEKVSKVLNNDYFKIVLTSDIFGVQIGGALKNLVAIACGMLDGLGCKSNTQAFMFNSCLQEMVEFAEIFGAHKDTLYGLSGVSDLIATCTGNSSKNFKFGQDLALGNILSSDLEINLAGTGKDCDFCESKVNKSIFPEGINTAKSVHQIIELTKQFGNHEFKLNHNIFLGDRLIVKDGQPVNLPILEVIYDIIFGHKSVQELVSVLKNKN